MEFKIRLEAICKEVDDYTKVIGAITNNAKNVDTIANTFMDTHWSGAAKEQFGVNIKEWQSQMGKFLEEAESINKAFSEILNTTTIELQKRSDAFIDCIKL